MGRGLALATLGAMTLGLSPPAHAADVWLAAVDPVVRAAHKWDAGADYMDLFRPDAAWPNVAKQTRVFKIGPGFASQGREEDLKQVFAELQRRHIALALEIGMLSVSEHCHEKTEAYGEPGLVERVLSRIKRLGGDLAYIAMDEPFYYGHQYAGPDACKLSATQLAQDVAPNVAVAKRIFPGIRIGDVEVVYDAGDFLDATKGWVDAYAKATGDRLAFLHADESWSPQATQHLVSLAGFLKSRQVRFGVIYNAGPAASGDTQWTQAAIRHADQVETELGLRPDDALFQTWEPFPSRLLPESASGTLTSVALHYLKPRTRLSLRRDGVRLSGRLVDEQGIPVAHATIALGSIGDVDTAAMVRQSITGKVPANASAGVLALRANRELNCTACTGAVAASIGEPGYREGGGPQRLFPPARIDVAAAQGLATNSSRFPVTAGATFDFEARLAVRTLAERAASAGIIFVDTAGHEVQRRMIRLVTTEAPLGSATTAADGSFAFALPPAVASRALQGFSASYDGNDHVRGARAVVR
jgi:hypothetical protein